MDASSDYEQVNAKTRWVWFLEFGLHPSHHIEGAPQQRECERGGGGWMGRINKLKRCWHFKLRADSIANVQGKSQHRGKGILYPGSNIFRRKRPAKLSVRFGVVHRVSNLLSVDPQRTHLPAGSDFTTSCRIAASFPL